MTLRILIDTMASLDISKHIMIGWYKKTRNFKKKSTLLCYYIA